MIRFLLFLLAFLCTLTTTQTASAESFPVHITTSISSPYTPYLADYTEPASQKLAVNIWLKDHRVLDYSCKFRLTIEGVGITIRTKPYFMPQPTQIQGGVPAILYGEDLAEYFNPANLDFSGISRGDYTKGAKLPEGIYRFTLEVLDYHRGTVVSNKGTAVAWVILNDPPMLNAPKNGSKLTIIDPQNAVFNWTPRQTGSPNSAFTAEYIFRLVEVWPANRNPYDAFLSQQPLYEITTSFTQIVYGPSEPALIPGRKYAWQVQAKDTEGKDLFKNEGKSEVYVFQFGDAIGVPKNFRRDDGSNTSVLLLKWEPAPDGAIPEQYRVRYRQKGDTRGVWYESVTPQRWVAVPDLQRDTEYEMQIRAEATLQYSEYSQLVAFKTDANDKDGFECGKEDEDVPITSTQLLTALHWGDTITCGAFKLLVRKATGANGTFTGDGYLKVSLLHGAGVHCSFSGQINSDYQMISGGWESIYTPGGPAAQLIEDAMKIGEEPSSAAKDTTANQTPDYTIPGTIDSIYINRKGKIVVIDTEGNKSTYDQKKEDGRKGKAKDTIIADAAGNSYTVGADGKIEKTTGGKAQPASVMASLSVKERIVVIVIDQFDGEMAAWLRNNGKGGDIDDDLLLASELPACFKRDAGQLKYFRDKILPYYKEHPSELVDKIEADAGNRELFDKVAGHFSDASSVDWSKVPADEQEDFRNATGLALMDRIAPLVQFYDKAAPSLQTDDYKKWLAKVQAIYNYFKTCSNEGWESYQNEGIIPYCFWRDQKVPEAAYYSNADIPFTAGLIDGAYREAEGIYQLPELVRNVSRFPGRLVYAYTLAYWECRPEKLIANAEEYEYVLEQLAVMDEEGGLWNWLKEQWYNYKEQQQSLEKYFSDCHDANNLREGIDELYDIATNWNEITKLYSQVSQRISEYFNTLETADNIGRYERGRLVVPAVSTALTLGAGAATKVERIKNVLKSLRKASEGSWKKVTEGFGKFVAKGAGKYWRTATEMRDEVMAWAKAYRGKLPQTRQLDKFNKACAASYQKADGTIETVFGRNGGVLNTQATYPTMSAEKGLGLHPELAKRLPEKSMWPNTANCAECDAVNQALHNGAKWEDIQIHTIDIRPDGTMTDVIQCLDCQNILKNMYVTSQ